MKRRQIDRSKSQKSFKKNTGVKALNDYNPRNMRGGIRL